MKNDASWIPDYSPWSLTCMMLLGALFSAGAWLILNPPQTIVSMVCAAFLLPYALHFFPDWNTRVIQGAGILFWGAAGQFLTGLFAAHRFLLVAAILLSVWGALKLLRIRVCASLAVVLIFIGFSSPPGFYAAFDRSFVFLYSYVCALAAMALNDCFFPARARRQPTLTEQIELSPFSDAEILRMTLVLLIGCVFIKLTRMVQGYWVPLTSAFMYLGGLCGETVQHRGLMRTFGTLTGLIFGWLFLAVFLIHNDNYVYVLPLLGGLGFWVNYRFDNYFLYSALFTMAFAVYADFSTGDYAYVNMRQLIFARTCATALGALLPMLAEIFRYVPQQQISIKS